MSDESLKKARLTIVDLEQLVKDKNAKLDRLESEKRELEGRNRELERKNSHVKNQLDEARARLQDPGTLRRSLDNLLAQEERERRITDTYSYLGQPPHTRVYISGGHVTINNNSPRSPPRSDEK